MDGFKDVSHGTADGAASKTFPVADSVRQELEGGSCRGGATSQRVTQDNFSKLALAAFDSIDINRNEILEKGELEHAVKGNAELGCQSLEVARILNTHREAIEWFDGSAGWRGIDRKDIKRFDQIRTGDKGFYWPYIRESAQVGAFITGAFGFLPFGVLGGGAVSTVIGGGQLGFAVGAVGGIILAPIALGVGIAAGANYYSYRTEHVPKIKAFIKDIGAEGQINP